MSVSDINTKIDLAIAANEAGDYTTALKYLRSARMAMAAIPASAGGPLGQSLKFEPAAVDAMIKDLERQATIPTGTTAGGASTRNRIRRTNVEYRVAGTAEEDE